jgi:hypothetical protein
MRLFRLPRTINQTFSGASLYQFADDILSVRRIQNCAKRGLQSLSPPWIWIGEVEHGAPQARRGWETGSQRYVGQHARTEFQPECYKWQHSRRRHDRHHQLRTFSGRRFLRHRRPAPESISQNAHSDHAPSVRRTIVFDPDPNGVHDPFNSKIRDFPVRSWRLPRCAELEWRRRLTSSKPEALPRLCNSPCART